MPSGLQKSNGDEFQNDAVFVCVGNDDIHVPNKELPQSIHICTMAEKKKKLQDIINEIVSVEKNFKILVYANGFKKIRITEKIVKELGIDTFAYERTNIGKRRRAMKEKVYYSNLSHFAYLFNLFALKISSCLVNRFQCYAE